MAMAPTNNPEIWPYAPCIVLSCDFSIAKRSSSLLIRCVTTPIMTAAAMPEMTCFKTQPYFTTKLPGTPGTPKG